MEKFTIEDFIEFPNLNMSQLRTFLKDKGWLSIGESPYRKTLLERVFQKNGEIHSFEYRISKKTGHSWTWTVLENQGEYQKRKDEILRIGYNPTQESNEESHHLLIFQKDSNELRLLKFPDMVGKENFKLILKITEHKKK